MLAIVDSGSTKTQWCFLDKDGHTVEVLTGGLNPYVVDSKDIKDCLEKDLYPFINNQKVNYVFFYGAGCADPTKRTLLQTHLEDFFPHAEIDIESDLLGAAIALCGNGKGLVAILGTGAATCFFDGEKIARRVASLGYVLGDEGSGARIGAHFLSDYLREGMPRNLRDEFAPCCPYPLHEIIDFVYHGKQVGRTLGQMSEFASGRMQDAYIHGVLQEEFRAFFAKQILPYGDLLKDNELSILGSVAYHCQDVLREVAPEYGVRIGKIVKEPMQGLLDYYKPQAEALLRRASLDYSDNF